MDVGMYTYTQVTGTLYMHFELHNLYITDIRGVGSTSFTSAAFRRVSFQKSASVILFESTETWAIGQTYIIAFKML